MKYQEQDIEWRTSQKLISLRYAQRQMEKRVGQIISKSEKQLIWILEHPASYTAGTSSISGTSTPS
jgi:Lipoate-protein ligase B